MLTPPFFLSPCTREEYGVGLIAQLVVKAGVQRNAVQAGRTVRAIQNGLPSSRVVWQGDGGPLIMVATRRTFFARVKAVATIGPFIVAWLSRCRRDEDEHTWTEVESLVYEALRSHQ